MLHFQALTRLCFRFRGERLVASPFTEHLLRWKYWHRYVSVLPTLFIASPTVAVEMRISWNATMQIIWGHSLDRPPIPNSRSMITLSPLRRSVNRWCSQTFWNCSKKEDLCGVTIENTDSCAVTGSCSHNFCEVPWGWGLRSESGWSSLCFS